jgi:hypothetical protein
MVLSIGFIISVVALHSEYTPYIHGFQLDGFDRRPCFQINRLGASSKRTCANDSRN